MIFIFGLAPYNLENRRRDKQPALCHTHTLSSGFSACHSSTISFTKEPQFPPQPPASVLSLPESQSTRCLSTALIIQGLYTTIYGVYLQTTPMQASQLYTFTDALHMVVTSHFTKSNNSHVEFHRYNLP